MTDHVVELTHSVSEINKLNDHDNKISLQNKDNTESFTAEVFTSHDSHVTDSENELENSPIEEDDPIINYTNEEEDNPIINYTNEEEDDPIINYTNEEGDNSVINYTNEEEEEDDPIINYTNEEGDDPIINYDNDGDLVLIDVENYEEFEENYSKEKNSNNDELSNLHPLNYHDNRPPNYDSPLHNDSTTEDHETLPGDSTTTTDAGGGGGDYNDHIHKVESGCVTYTRLQDEAVLVSSSVRGGAHPYENWSIIMSYNREVDEMGLAAGKRKKLNHTRLKGTRIPNTRPRPPQPLPRSNYTKVKMMPRPPAPLPRKRRISANKLLRPLQVGGVSEGDMAQADEMGEEGLNDDGFVDSNENINGGRRRKKRQPGIAPVLSTAVSPPSSPLNTPHSSRRRVTPSRKGRTKARQKKTSKPIPASADISTQETTTPGPASSETDDSELIEEGELTTPIHKLVVEEEEEEEMSARIIHKPTPPITKTTPTKTTPIYGRPLQQVNNGLNEGSKKPKLGVGGKQPVGGVKVTDKSTNESQTSDTELTSTSALSLSGGGGGRGRRLDSDLSTAPLSSETSDMSENEKGQISKKVTTTGTTSVSHSSPTLPRKGATQSTAATRTPTRSGKAGNFVSKRSSVSAMISQFDSGPKSSASTRPHPSIKPSLSAKPNVKPKPPTSPKLTTPPVTTPSESIKEESLKPKPVASTRMSPSTSSTRMSPSTSSTRMSPSTSSTRISPSTSSTRMSTVVATGTSDDSGSSSSPSSGKRSGAKTTTSIKSTTTNTTVGGVKKSSVTAKTTEVKQVGGTTKPVGGVTKPVGGTTKTVGGATKTVGGVTKTVGGATKPVGGARNSSKVETTKSLKTATSSERLASGKTTPTSGKTTPTSGKITPTSGRATPTSGRATPTSGKATPTTNEGKGTPPLLTRGSSAANSTKRLSSAIKATPTTNNKPLLTNKINVNNKKGTPSGNKTTPTTSSDELVKKADNKTKLEKTESIDKKATPTSAKTTPTSTSTNTSTKATPTVKTVATPTSSVDTTTTSETIDRNKRRVSPRRPPPEPPQSPTSPPPPPLPPKSNYTVASLPPKSNSPLPATVTNSLPPKSNSPLPATVTSLPPKSNSPLPSTVTSLPPKSDSPLPPKSNSPLPSTVTSLPPKSDSPLPLKSNSPLPSTVSSPPLPPKSMTSSISLSNTKSFLSSTFSSLSSPNFSIITNKRRPPSPPSSPQKPLSPSLSKHAPPLSPSLSNTSNTKSMTSTSNTSITSNTIANTKTNTNASNTSITRRATFSIGTRPIISPPIPITTTCPTIPISTTCTTNTISTSTNVTNFNTSSITNTISTSTNVTNANTSSITNTNSTSTNVITTNTSSTLTKRAPPPPPISSTTSTTSNSKNSTSKPQLIKSSSAVAGSSKPQNYEEFIPTLIRSGSLSSQPSSPPPLTTPAPISLYEGVDFSAIREANISNKCPPPQTTSSSSDSETPPPLPPRNYFSDMTTLEEREGPPTPINNSPRLSKTKSAVIDMPPPLPSQPIPKRKNTFSHTISPLLKRDEIVGGATSFGSPPLPVRANKINVYEEITLGPAPHRGRSSSSSSITRKTASLETKHSRYEASDDFKKTQKDSPSSSYVKLSPPSSDTEDQRRFSASICVTDSLGVSPVSLRRANSDKQSNRTPLVITPLEQVDSSTNSSATSTLQKASSMDILDDRMQPRTSLTDPGYSSGDEEDSSCTLSNVGLPQPPKSFIMPVKTRVSPSRQDPDEEPLYQYINHADFTTPVTFPADKSSTVPSKTTTNPAPTNQLEIARQLSFNHRKLWCEQPEVIQSGVLGMISDQDRKLQEAMYEVLTSEASYLRSLNVLIEHFMEDPGMNPNLPEGRRVLDKRQHHVIFSNVREVQGVCSRFLKDLQERQRESAISQNICDIILKYAEGEFSCYIPYCTNQVYQMREFTHLIENNVMFQDYLKRLETHKRCQNLSLTSFLLLPMQRITRLPLLVLAILNRTPMDNPNHPLVEKALRTVQKLVTACNDGARQMERTEELHLIHKQLEFIKMKPFPLVSVSRQLERKGQLFLLQVEQRLFGKPRIKRIPVYVFVFTDYVLITKKKNNPKTGGVTYRVLDYASKAVVETVAKLKVLPNISFPKHVFGEQEMLGKATWAVSMAEEHNAFLLVFLENSFQKSEKYIMVTQNETDHTRWLESLSHPAKEKQNEDEKIYESWDCPQVQAVYDYTAQQHDELGLMRGDIVKVYRKMADGWYEGERLRDLQLGWFPSNFTVEIENAHTRARNLKERHRLLSLPFNPDDFLQHFNASS